MKTLRAIIAKAGRPTQVAYKLGVSEISVHRWVKRGVPFKFWQPLMKLSGCTVEELYAANKAVKYQRATKYARQ
jgi:hypothetical protein